MKLTRLREGETSVINIILLIWGWRYNMLAYVHTSIIVTPRAAAVPSSSS